jgi:hypothetical protein
VGLEGWNERRREIKRNKEEKRCGRGGNEKKAENTLRSLAKRAARASCALWCGLFVTLCTGPDLWSTTALRSKQRFTVWAMHNEMARRCTGTPDFHETGPLGADWLKL